MWGILRKKRLASVAVISSLALLFTSIIPCNCLALDSFDKSENQPKSHHSESSHPCGSHSSADHDVPDGNSTGDRDKTHSHGSDSSCCCEIQSPSALVDAQALAVAQSKVIQDLELVPLANPFLNFGYNFVDTIKILPRGSPSGGLPFALTSSSTLSVRLQRWLI